MADSRSLRESVMRFTLNRVRSQGHTCVEIREREKRQRLFFFCALCRAPCNDENVLDDHLKGKRHENILTGSNHTFKKPNPWPFNDGFVFVDPSFENTTGKGKAKPSMVIPGVVVKGKVTDLHVSEVGLGLISARYRRISLHDLGLDHVPPLHDFAVVTFAYNIQLDRPGTKESLDDASKLTMLLSSSPTRESGNGDGTGCKRKRSVSDSKDITDSLFDIATRLISREFHKYQPFDTRSMTKRSIRRDIRRLQRLWSARICVICQHRMLPGEDVATLMNLKTGKLACSSRNVNGAFHVFHTSCLIHWILWFEVEIFKNRAACSKSRRTSSRKTATKFNEKDDQLKFLSPQIYSVFCPDCQGTGIVVDSLNGLEKPNRTLDEVFEYKKKISFARAAWIQEPEMLKNCSIGFLFHSQNVAKF